MDAIQIGVVPILVALIAAVVSFVGLVVSKESKISEFRQKWIDELRQDISKYISYTEKHAFIILTLYKGKSDTPNVEKKSDASEVYLEQSPTIDNLYHMIVLRLNPKEHKKFLSILEEERKYYAEYVLNSEAYKDSWKGLSKCNNLLRIESTELLKKEWEQVKRGEKWFRYTKWAVLIIVGILTITIIYVALSHKAKPNEVPKSTNKAAAQIDNDVSTMSNDGVQRTR
jgi:cell division protein FtsL